MDVPLSDSPVNEERIPQGFGGTARALVLKATPPLGLQRSVLDPGALDPVLVLPLLPGVWMKVALFQGHQSSVGPPWPRGSQLSFPCHLPLLPVWGNPGFLLHPIISLCSCAMPARAVGE